MRSSPPSASTTSLGGRPSKARFCDCLRVEKSRYSPPSSRCCRQALKSASGDACDVSCGGAVPTLASHCCSGAVHLDALEESLPLARFGSRSSP
eukprot:3461244-Prymnesium_polylepis.3